MIRPSSQKSLQFKDYERLTHMLARKLHARAAAVDRRGTASSYMDIFQDLALIWTQCRDQFDPSRGLQFSTYYMTAALNHWKVISKQAVRNNTLVSLDEPLDLADEEGLALQDLISDPTDLNPEESLGRKEWVERSMEESPVLARLLELSADPPEELRAELAALEAQRAWAQQQGLEASQKSPAVLTPKLLERTFGFNWRHRLAMRPQTIEDFA